MKRLLVIHTWGIGDWLFFKPTLDQLRETYRELEIDIVLGTPGTRAIVALSEPAARIFIFDVRKRPYGLLSIAAQLWLRKYDLILFTAGVSSRKADIAAALFRGRRKLALLTGDHAPLFLTGTVPYDPALHMVENNLRLLNLAGVGRPQFPYPQLKVEPGEAAGAVLIHPGCDRKNAYRRWPASRFAELASRLLARGESVDVVLGPDELELAEAFADLVKVPKFRLLTGLKLEALLAQIAGCRVFINSDSGLGHLAAALARPVVTIFGPADARATRPYARRVALIEPLIPLACRPCTVPGGRHGCAERPCLMSIDVDRVEKAYLELVGVPERRA